MDFIKHFDGRIPDMIPRKRLLPKKWSSSATSSDLWSREGLEAVRYKHVLGEKWNSESVQWFVKKGTRT